MTAATVVLMSGSTSPHGNPRFSREAFTHPRENPFFPLRPGTKYYYEAIVEDGIETAEVFITHETRQIMGVDVRVVRDRVWLNGSLIEEAFDWMQTDNVGNLWYFGEGTTDFDNGQVVTTAGSWEAGRDGAMPGILMPAHPRVGMRYDEEAAPGQAEDWAVIKSVNATVPVHPDWPYMNTTWPFTWNVYTATSREWRHCVKTKNFNPSEPEFDEWKYYAEGVGLVHEKAREDGEPLEHKRLITIVLP